MADLGENFKSSDNRGEPMTPVPAGVYECVISDTEIRDTANGGKMLKITYTILTGEAKGRKIWQNLNLRNKNEQAVRIAREHLAAVCDAAGVPEVRDTTKLHMRRVQVVVKVDQNDEYGAQNSVRKVLPSVSKVPENTAEKRADGMRRDDGLDAPKQRPAWLRPSQPAEDEHDGAGNK